MKKTVPRVLNSAAFCRGVTLVEMLIGVAVVGVILAVAAPSLSEMMERRRVIAVAGELAGFMTFARAEANTVADSLNLHMEPDPTGQVSCMSLSTLTLFDTCKCSQWATRSCPTGSTSVLLREFHIPRGNRQVYFDASATQWAADQYVVTFARNKFFSDIKGVGVTITGPRSGIKLRVEYNDVGRVRTCSPDGSMSGYPVCG